jgi:hypothetical protein
MSGYLPDIFIIRHRRKKEKKDPKNLYSAKLILVFTSCCSIKSVIFHSKLVHFSFIFPHYPFVLLQATPCEAFRPFSSSFFPCPLPLRLEAIGVWVWSGGGWCFFVWFLEVLLVDFWLVFVFWWLGRAWLGWEDLSLYFGLYGLYFSTFYKPL